MRICCWNVRRASVRSRVWELFAEISPDLALLQEVSGIPIFIAAEYQSVTGRAAGNRFNTAILTRGAIGPPIQLSSRWDWVNRELELFRGNLIAHSVSLLDQEYRVLSAYSPAWPVDPKRLRGVEVAPVKLPSNPDVWVTELLWAALQGWSAAAELPAWVVGGDLNSSETFDHPRPRGNREILDRMRQLGFVECLRHCNRGELVPTFRNPRDGRMIHQMDHLFVSEPLATRLLSCSTADPDQVFAGPLSDHLPIIADFGDHIDGAV